MLQRLRDVFKSFDSHEVRYVVIGGIASVLYGVPRATFDLDILIEATPSNAQRLLDALTEIGFGTATLTSADKIARSAITSFRDRIPIDVLTEAPGLAFEDVWARKEAMTYQGQQLYVLSRADLIRSKRASGREVDLEDARLLDLTDKT